MDLMKVEVMLVIVKVQDERDHVENLFTNVP